MAELRVVVLPGGQLQIFGDTGTFAETKQATEHILALLQAQGLPVQMQGQVEQHRPDGPDHIHVIQQTAQTAQQEGTHGGH